MKDMLAKMLAFLFVEDDKQHPMPAQQELILWRRMQEVLGRIGSEENAEQKRFGNSL